MHAAVFLTQFLSANTMHTFALFSPLAVTDLRCRLPIGGTVHENAHIEHIAVLNVFLQKLTSALWIWDAFLYKPWKKGSLDGLTWCNSLICPVPASNNVQHIPCNIIVTPTDTVCKINKAITITSLTPQHKLHKSRSANIQHTEQNTHKKQRF